MYLTNMQVWMRLDRNNTVIGLQLVPATYGMDVPSACTIVIIAGKWYMIYLSFNFIYEYIIQS